MPVCFELHKSSSQKRRLPAHYREQLHVLGRKPNRFPYTVQPTFASQHLANALCTMEGDPQASLDLPNACGLYSFDYDRNAFHAPPITNL